MSKKNKVVRCKICGEEITDDMAAWECPVCGRIVCESCYNTWNDYCDECNEKSKSRYDFLTA
ncbi:MAG: hypothetical protein LBP26_06295 [Clostridiales bacterium]|jgi:predicted RNA-binding Zn-ribbon protein involved in translation (DUF1610 family)|nr:hypothetical protein [Clostridiales bacterium]